MIPIAETYSQRVFRFPEKNNFGLRSVISTYCGGLSANESDHRRNYPGPRAEAMAWVTDRVLVDPWSIRYTLGKPYPVADMSCVCTSQKAAVVAPVMMSSVSPCGCPTVNRGIKPLTPQTPYALPSVMSTGAVVVPRRCDVAMVAPVASRVGTSMVYPSVSACGRGCRA
jgi:hypothetical protein